MRDYLVGVGEDVGIMQDVLKIASGVFLGMMAFWIVTVALPAVMPPRAALCEAEPLRPWPSVPLLYPPDRHPQWADGPELPACGATRNP